MTIKKKRDFYGWTNPAFMMPPYVTHIIVRNKKYWIDNGNLKPIKVKVTIEVVECSQ